MQECGVEEQDEAGRVERVEAEEVERDSREDEAPEPFRPGRLPRWFLARTQEELMTSSRIVDVPAQWGPGMPAVPEEDQAERCSYVGPTDRKCGRRATEKGMCKIHARWELWTEWGWPMVCPDDRESVQEAMRQTLSWLMAGHVTEKQALAVVAICRAILRAL